MFWLATDARRARPLGSLMFIIGLIVIVGAIVGRYFQYRPALVTDCLTFYIR